MLVNLTSNDFEQGFIYTGSMGGYNSTSTDAYWNQFRIRTKESFTYNGDGETITFNITTNNNPTSLYVEISMYDENGKYIDASISYFSKNQATKISDNVFQHVFKHNGYLSTGVRTFRVSLTKTVDVSPKDSQKITIDDLNTVEIFSEEYWKMGTSGPELTSTPIINEAMTQPYPSTLWRIGPTEYNGKNYYNKGTPYHMLLNDVPELYILGEYWMIDSYPFIDGLKLIPVFEDPKPLGLFSIDGGYPYYEGRKLINVLEEPEPLGIFRSNGGYPFFRGLNLIQIGAFSNATNLKYATIPESVKYIGEYAFRGTQLKEVKLADDCEYYSTSFPHNCVVNGGIIKT